MFSTLASVFGIDEPDGSTTDEDNQTDTETLPRRSTDTDHPPETPSDDKGVDEDLRVVDRLIEELEAEELTPSERATLQDAFGGAPTRSESVSLEHLKAEVMDLRAYTDALEALIDADGTADDRFEACHDRIDTLDAELETLREELTAVDSTANIDRIEARMDDLETAIETLHQDLETVKSTLADLEAWQAGIKAAVDADETAASEEFDPSASTTEMIFEVE